MQSATSIEYHLVDGSRVAVVVDSCGSNLNGGTIDENVAEPRLALPKGRVAK
jgi:hypothetical protein